MNLKITIALAVLFVVGDTVTTALFVGSNGIEEGNLMPSLAIAGFGIMGLVLFKGAYLGMMVLAILVLNRLNFEMLAGGFATILLVSGMIATISNILTFTVRSFHGLQFWPFCFLIFFFSILLNAEWRTGCQKLLWREKIFPPSGRALKTFLEKTKDP